MALRGVFEIVHVPFEENGDIDWRSMDRQIEFYHEVGVHGLVVPANASEFYTLSDEERVAVVERVASVNAQTVPLVVGVQAPTARAAVRFAGHAADQGAAAVMALPPYLRTPSRPVLSEYYRSIATVGLDTIIQNAPAPLGAPQASTVLAELLKMHECVSYLKEETPPILHRITAAVTLAGSDCKGVFGGANGSVMVEELDRGACGNMPAGGLVDVQVQLYNAYAAGDRSRAMEIQDRLLPLLFHAGTYGVTLHKHILWRRAVLATPCVRDPQAIYLDEHDVAMIDERLASLRDLLSPAGSGRECQRA